MDLYLKDKVAIVTGGGGGCGKAYCLAFAEEGSKVVVADMNEEAAHQVASEIISSGGKALSLKVDVSSWNDVSKMIQVVLKEFGKIDILVNNAGKRWGMSKVEEFPEELWQKDIDVNLKGVYYCIKAVAAHMKERQYGKIVNQSSNSALTGHKTGGSAYAAAKAGVLGFSRSMSQELAPFNITVNAVSPGMIDTPFSADIPKERRELVVKTSPLGRMAIPEDLVGLVLFLSSDRSSYITGQTIIVDGGQRTT